jgi:cytochrome P450
LTASIEAAAHEIVSEAVRRRRVDFVTDVAAKLPLEVIWTFLGIPAADREQVTAWSSDAFCAGSPAERSIAHLEILDYFDGLVRQRRRRPGDDLVSVLATVEIDGEPLPVDDVVLNCDNLLVGGTENVRLAMSGGIHALLARPGQWELLREGFERVVPTAIEEVLRWTSSATHLVRVARTGTEVGGTPIARGERVVLWLPAANRDPAEFPDPHRFELTRSPNRHLALGAGPHYCVGIQLAKLEIRAVLRELSNHVRRIQPAGRPERWESLVVNGYRNLPVELEADPGPDDRGSGCCSALVRVVGSDS